MKPLKIFILLVLTSSFFITSCSDNDNEDRVIKSNLVVSDKASDIIDLWQLTSIAGLTNLSDCQKKSTIQFDGSSYKYIQIVDIAGSSDCLAETNETGIYQIKGNGIFVNREDQARWEFSLSDTSLSISKDGVTEVYKRVN